MYVNSCSKCEYNDIEINVSDEGQIYLFCGCCWKSSDLFYPNISLTTLVDNWNEKNEKIINDQK